MNKIKRFIFLIPLLIASSGCTGCLVNRLAFHPEKVPKDTPDIKEPFISEFFIESLDGTKIHSFYFEHKGAENVVLYLHGNAGHSYQRLNDVFALSKTGTNVLLIDYRGFGKSDGSPSEKGIYRDATAAFNYLIKEKKFSENNIFVLGRSIGTTAAIEVSQNKNIGGLILICPLSTGKDMAKVMGLGWFSWLAGSSFDNMSKVKNIQSPVLFIHGDRDEVIPFSLGEKVYNAVPHEKKNFIKVQGAGHNDLIQLSGPMFWTWIEKFMAS